MKKSKIYVVGILAFVSLFSAAGLFVPTRAAQALSCLVPDIERDIEEADVIFEGWVMGVEPATSDTAAHADFGVLQHWKGNVGGKITVGNIYKWTGTENRESYYENGKTYLVFAVKEPGSDSTKNLPGRYAARIDCSVTSFFTTDEIKAKLGVGTETADKDREPRTDFIIPNPTIVDFKVNLTVGSVGTDVVALQSWLETQGYLVMPAGVSKGYFGQLTRAAVAKFQAVQGINPSVGYFGPVTRAKIKAYPPVVQ